MKKLLIIPMLFVCFVSIGQYTPNASKFYDLKNDFSRDAILRIAHVDFGDKMTWDDAVYACASLGPGWRLPTKVELQLLYDNKDYIFRNRDDNNGYWGSEEEGDQAWSFSTWGGSKGYYYPKSGTARVRAVTTSGIENPLPGVIGLSMRVINLEVAQNDFPNEMTYNDAVNACASLGPGWRLPTVDELNILYQNKNEIFGFANSYYWSSPFNNTNYAWLQYFNNGKQDFSSGLQSNYDKDTKCNVRAVRSITEDNSQNLQE